MRLIHLYAIRDDPEAVLQVVDFRAHNNPNAREAASKLPAPNHPDVSAVRFDVADDNTYTSVQCTDKSVGGPCPPRGPHAEVNRK